MSEVDAQSLILGDRMNWPFILGMAILKFEEAIVQPEGSQSEQQVREAALVIRNLIPSQWVKADPAFAEDLEKAITTRKIDVRMEWCGVKVGPPKFEVEEDLDPYRMVHACINVFQRRGLLSKVIFTEKMVPEPEDLEDLEATEKEEAPTEEPGTPMPEIGVPPEPDTPPAKDTQFFVS